jgi:putative adenylate-forming enzyme
MSAPTASARETTLASLQAQAAEVIARDRWSRGQILAYQQQQLRKLLAHAITKSPYYRETFGARDVDELRFDELPTLPKATLVDQFDRIVTDPRLWLDALEEHLRGPDPEAPFEGGFRIFSTSGTTGLRALIVYTEAEFRFWVTASLRIFARAGITTETRLAAIGAPHPLHITRQLFAAFRTGRAGAPELSVLTPLDEIVSALNEYQPEAVITYASIGGLLAQEQLEGRLRISPDIVSVGSEVLTDEARGWIDSAWNLQPVEVYASTETLYLASSMPPHPGLHLHEDLALIEVVDEDNRPAPPGEPGYKVLVTNLINRAQPLIRYELSDSAILAAGPDSSGLPFQRLAAVDGRSDDILRFPSASGGEVAVHPYRLRAPFADFGELRQYQIVQHERGLEVRVVLQPSAPSDTPARVQEAVLDALGEAGAVPPPVEVVTVETIERESGHAAKLKLVKTLAPAR